MIQNQQVDEATSISEGGGDLAGCNGLKGGNVLSAGCRPTGSLWYRETLMVDGRKGSDGRVEEASWA